MQPNIYRLVFFPEPLQHRNVGKKIGTNTLANSPHISRIPVAYKSESMLLQSVLQLMYLNQMKQRVEVIESSCSEVRNKYTYLMLL